MNDGFRRFAILLFVFLLAFVAVVALRRLQSGERFADLFHWGEEDPTDFTYGERNSEKDLLLWRLGFDLHF